jgi:hypothetical protein
VVVVLALELREIIAESFELAIITRSEPLDSFQELFFMGKLLRLLPTLDQRGFDGSLSTEAEVRPVGRTDEVTGHYSNNDVLCLPTIMGGCDVTMNDNANQGRQGQSGGGRL